MTQRERLSRKRGNSRDICITARCPFSFWYIPKLIAPEKVMKSVNLERDVRREELNES
jgi:hypothetical protein